MNSPPSDPLPHIVLTLAGSRVGDLRGLDGLQLEADIVEDDLGPNGASAKHVSNVRWTPGLLTLGLGMGAAAAAWLQNSFALSAPPMTGSIVLADDNDRAQSVVDFTDAVLTQLTVPALDGASPDPGVLLVGFQASTVRVTQGDGGDTRGPVARAPKPWLCSNFGIQIGALPCVRVGRVESFTWTAASANAEIGIFRTPATAAWKATVPDLQLSISAVDYAPWAAAARKWFIDGNHLAGDEMAGRITLLAPDGSELAGISLVNVGFRRFPMIFIPKGGAADRFIVTLYVEAMSFDLTAQPPG